MKGRDLEAYVVRILSAVYPDARQSNNSGAVSANGDVLAGPWLIDCKGTSVGTSCTVKKTDYEKSRREAWHHRKEPLFIRSNCEGTALASMELTLLAEILSELHRFKPGEPGTWSSQF